MFGLSLKKFNYRDYPPRLNLGCGFDIRQGYLNIDFKDFHKPDLIADICNLDMLPSDYYEEIIAQDVLEHIPRTQTKNVLSEWYRLLKRGGILNLRVPNVIGLLRLFENKYPNSLSGHEELIHCLFGTQAYNGDFHHTSFTDILIEHYLNNAGFTILSIDPKDEWLFDIEARKL